MQGLKLTAPQALLCAAVADTLPSERAAAVAQLRATLGDEATFALGQTNDVATLLAHSLLEIDSDASLSPLAVGTSGENSLPEHWREAHTQLQRRLSAYLTEMDRVAAALSQAGISMVALKNAGIARGIYPCPACCPMGDLDVLVEKKNFRQAHAIMLANDYHFEFRSPLEEAELQAAEEGGGAEYWKILPDGEKLWFELQWRPVAGRWIRPDQEPPAEVLMARSVPISGTAVRLLAPQDNLLQVALHTAKHTYVRAPGYRLHTDVDRIVRRQPIDWDSFVAQVKALQVKTAVYFSLAIPRALFHTPIPDEVLESLRPPSWKERLMSRWLQRAGIFNPDERKFSKLGFICFTMLLYDDLGGLRRAALPDREWMRVHYAGQENVALPRLYWRRLLNLVSKRNAT